MSIGSVLFGVALSPITIVVLTARRPAVLLRRRVPVLTSVGPVYVLSVEPARVSLPGPFLVSPAAPLTTPSMVRTDTAVAVSFTMKLRSATLPSATLPVMFGWFTVAPSARRAVTVPASVSVPAPVVTSPPVSVSGPTVSEAPLRSSVPPPFTMTSVVSGI